MSSSELRHGLLNDQSFLDNLQSHYYSHYDLKRNTTSANPSPEDLDHKIPDWKSQGNNKKTTTAALVLCLNLGIPPPDIQRPQDCPYLESFVNPTAYSDPKKALQTIGRNLQLSYESISSRTKYKQSLDPSVEDLKRLCTTLRRNAKDERILFHYNGHGVPQPTQSGEIWVFNRGYTQYIPVSLYDLQNWIGAPCIFVIDTSAAGNVIENNKKFIQKRIDDEAKHRGDSAAPSLVSSYIESLQLGACRSNEILPMNPDLPADLFTCCLTSPIEMSVKWFVLSSPLRKEGEYEIMKDKDGQIEIPGRLTDRRTPLGELNWIFIAVTDTIAWTSLPRPLFKKLFRQDLMVAALFRNFLLAKKIMPLTGCHPISDPPLPDVNDHPMWDAWELAIDEVLSQLVKQKKLEKPKIDMSDIPQLQPPEPEPASHRHHGGKQHQNNRQAGKRQSRSGPVVPETPQSVINYQHSSFFEQHLTAFEIWLQYGSSTKEPPQQLPVVLQVLLSQAHRLRALHLLSNFLDLGPWAVYLALSIGIFPYILRLLQSPSPELKPVLTFIWTRIMSVDYKNTQQELFKDRRYNYFVQIFSTQLNQGLTNGETSSSAVATNTGTPNPGFPTVPVAADGVAGSNLTFDDQKAMSAFVLSCFVRGFKNGQKVCFSVDLVKTCIYYIENSESPLLRQWSAMMIGELLDNHIEAIAVFMKSGLTTKLLHLIGDPIPEVRASIIDALLNFIVFPESEEDIDREYSTLREELNQQELQVAVEVLNVINDGSPLIRREANCFFSRFVVKYLQFFIVSAFGQLEEEIALIDNPAMIDEIRRQSPAYGSVFSSVWKALLIASEDPHDEVRDYAEQIVDYVLWKMNESALCDIVQAMEDYLLQKRGAVGNLSPTSTSSDISGLVHLRGINPKVDERRVQSMTVKGRPSTGQPHMLRSMSSSSNISLGQKLLSRAAGWLKSLNLSEDYDGDETSSMFKLSLQQQPTTLAYGTLPRPTTPRFHPRPNDGGKPTLPLKSQFFEYSCEYFQEPQLGKKESDEPGSEEYTKRLWRRNRNETIIAETQPQKELALRGNWNNMVATLNNRTQPKLLKFTQFENWLVATDERDAITTFDWKNQVELSKFSNGNPFGTKISDVKFLNEDDVPLLLTGSSDGVIKIYKNFDDLSEYKLITAWRALTDILLTPRSVGLISEWQQSRGTLLVTGDVKIIKIWDAPREKCTVDIPLRSTSQITSLTSDQVSGDIFVGGFRDGTIRVYDRRLDARDSMIKLYRPKIAGARASIKSVHMQRGGMRELVSGSSNGLVQLWDIRMDDPILKFKAFEKAMTTAMIHEHAPVIACASKTVDIYSTAGQLISGINSMTFMDQLNGTTRSNSYINSLAMHPHRMMLATNHNQNASVCVYQCSENAVEEY
ncbi:DEKNAAC100376 [Brettanomyces naardenensis]|uniref:DEKNAAC100376 n=1 Tax=Brettanomyces naardenensis TaxID=13370 RepID=A0A448YFU0_BRENA|nr:DEKNAAC100376 [Brettanomyces naardenensis]